MNPVQWGITLSGAIITANYSAYAEDVSVLVTSSTNFEEVSKKIDKYKSVSGAKTNSKKSVVLQLGSWKVSALGPFS